MDRCPSAVVTSQRKVCPQCRQPLKQARPGQSGAVGAQIIAEPDIIAAWHLSSSCPASCQQARYWCGFVEFRMLRQNKRCTLRKEIDLPDPDYFFLNSRTGLARSWLRRWRYRMYLHRASFQGEGILLRLLNAAVRYHIRHQLREGWLREILCRRAAEAGVDVSKTLHEHVLNGTAEKLIAANWIWYEPLMFARLGRSEFLVVDAPTKIFPKRHKTVQRLAKFILSCSNFLSCPAHFCHSCHTCSCLPGVLLRCKLLETDRTSLP